MAATAGLEVAGMMSASVFFGGAAAATFARLSSSAAASPFAWFAIFEMPFAASPNVGAPCWRILSPIDSSPNRWPIGLVGAPKAAAAAGVSGGVSVGSRVADDPALVLAVVSVVSACGRRVADSPAVMVAVVSVVSACVGSLSTAARLVVDNRARFGMATSSSSWMCLGTKSSVVVDGLARPSPVSLAGSAMLRRGSLPLPRLTGRSSASTSLVAFANFWRLPECSLSSAPSTLCIIFAALCRQAAFAFSAAFSMAAASAFSFASNV